MASLLATALVMSDRPQAVANAKFLIVANNNKNTTICDRDVPLFLEGRNNAFIKAMWRESHVLYMKRQLVSSVFFDFEILPKL
jgi:hypothetical protein